MSARGPAILLLLLASVPTLAAERDDPPLNPLRSLDETRLKAFVEAPLFDPARRRPPVVPPALAPASTEKDEAPPRLRLLGVIHAARDVAMVRRDDAPKAVFLATGDHVDDWEVLVLPTNGLRLSNGSRAYDYAMFTKPGAPAGPVAVTPTDPSAPSQAAHDP